MHIPKQFLLPLITFIVMQGCYTQLRDGQYTDIQQTLDTDKLDHDTSQVTDTFFFTIDTLTKNGDTTIDTTWYSAHEQLPNKKGKPINRFIVQSTTFPFCIWLRDFLGNPQLKCFDSWYEYRQYLGMYAPWWIHDQLYGYHSLWQCPPGYFYDPYSGFCRHRNDFRRRFSHVRYGWKREPGGGGTRSGYSPRNPRRYQSSDMSGSDGYSDTAIEHRSSDETGLPKQQLDTQQQSISPDNTDGTSRPSENDRDTPHNNQQRKNPRGF